MEIFNKTPNHQTAYIMDNEELDDNNDSINSSSSTILVSHGNTGPSAADNYLNYDFGYPFNFSQSKNSEQGKIKLPPFSAKSKKYDYSTIKINPEPKCMECNDSAEPFAHVKLDSLIKLKDSTRKLICLLEEIQSKTRSKNLNTADNRLSELLHPIPNTSAV